MDIVATTKGGHRISAFAVDMDSVVNSIGIENFVEGTHPLDMSYTNNITSLLYEDDNNILLIRSDIELHDGGESFFSCGELDVTFRNETAQVRGKLYIRPGRYPPIMGRDTYVALISGADRRVFLADIGDKIIPKNRQDD